MNEEERVIEAVPADYEEAMQTATFDETPIPVVEEPLSPDLARERLVYEKSNRRS